MLRSVTPYPEVDAVLEKTLAGVQAILGERLVGMYLHGSLACGDFAPQRSDIDFLVVTTGELPDETLPALAEMHARLVASGLKWADKMEGSYIPQEALRRHDPARASFPALRVDGSFAVDGHGTEWIIQRHLLREKGIALAGPDLHGLIDPVLPDDLRRAQRQLLHGWWAQQAADPFRLRSREYQAYATLTMCRAFYTLEHGTVVSKAAAAGWAQERLGAGWRGLIEQALAWPVEPQPDEFEATLAFIRYTLERC